MCPKFLIQPFVENAVTHAFEDKDDKWVVVTYRGKTLIDDVIVEPVEGYKKG